jgi:hypothetical protein
VLRMAEHFTRRLKLYIHAKGGHIENLWICCTHRYML